MSEELNIESVGAKKNLLSSNKGKLLVALVLVLGALSYFGFIAFRGATQYYLTVGQLEASANISPDETVRVMGKLVPNSYYRDDSNAVATFSITDGTNVLPATYKGAIPDLFSNSNSSIILEGTYSNNKFDAQNIIVKCPSKYVAEATPTTK